MFMQRFQWKTVFLSLILCGQYGFNLLVNPEQTGRIWNLTVDLYRLVTRFFLDVPGTMATLKLLFGFCFVLQ